jgi:serine protease Do
MIFLLLASLLTTSPAYAKPADSGALAALFSSLNTFLNGPVRRAPRVTAVAAVRGGIPTDQGEDLDLRLLDRVRALRAALLRPDPSPGDVRAAASAYDALAASEFVQALAVAGAAEAPKKDAAAALSKWARALHSRPLTAELKKLLTGPAAAIDDKTLVAAGWGAYARALSPADATILDAKPGWGSSPDAARLDESLKSVRDSVREKKLAPEAEARAHVLAGRVLLALAAADLRGKSDAGSLITASAPVPALDAGPAPAPAADVPFDPKKIYASASKSVALILCTANEGSGELGTGSVVDAGRRRILTNAHVVIRDATHEPWPVIHVYFKPAHMTGDSKQDMRDPVAGRVVAFDRALDLALVEVDSLPEGAAALALDDPRGVEVGDRVAAIGHPEQGGLWTLTTGVISTLVADVGGVKGKNAFQTDTSINRGNSGGPLLDARGAIVGVNTSMARKAADGLAITSVNFALRSDVARQWMAAQDETLAYGGASPRFVAAAPAVYPTRTSHPSSIPVTAPAAAPAATRVTITESKPFKNEDLIAAEIAKMESMGDDMRRELERKLAK